MPRPPRNSDRRSEGRSDGRPEGRPDRRPAPKWNKPRRSADAARGDAARAAQGSADLPEELRDSSRGERLQKVLASAGVAARRECEAMILAGRVTVNGHRVLSLPAWADPREDRIEVDGRLLPRPSRLPAPVSLPIPHGKHGAGGPQVRTGKGARPARPAADAAHHEAMALAADRVYIALNKPRNTITTASDPEGRRSVLDLVELPPNFSRRIFPVGRLDADSTGLLLLTNDGELANRLTHPRYGVVKEYLVSVKGTLTAEDIEQLQEGLYLAHPTKGRARTRPPGARPPVAPAAPGAPADPAGVRVKRAAMEDVVLLEHQRDVTRGDRTRLLVRLREGQNREIRRLMARLGFKVRRLQRVAIGPVTLKGLAVGSWRMLTPQEVKGLFRASMESSKE